MVKIYNTLLNKYSESNIAKRFSLLLFANFISMISQWSVLSVLSKKSDLSFLGEFSLSLAFVSPIIMFAGLQLKPIVASDTSVQYSINDYLRVRVFTGLFSLALIFFIAFSFYREYISSILLLAIAKTFEGLSDVIYGGWLREGKVSKICISTLFKSIFGWGVFSVLCSLHNSLEIGLIYLIFIQLMTFVFYDVKNNNVINETILIFEGITKYISIFKVGFFLGITSTLSSLCINIPRYFIENKMGSKQLGIFTALCYVWIATGYVSNSIGDGYLSSLSELITKGNYKNVKKKLILLLKGVVIITPVFLILVYFLKDIILTFIYSPIFREYSTSFLLVMMLVPVSFLYTFIVNYYISSRIVFFIMSLHVISVLTICIFSYFFVPSFGMNGAVISMILGFFLLIVLGIINIFNDLNKKMIINDL